MSLVPFPQNSEPGFLWFEWFRELRKLLNKATFEATAAPTTDVWKQGDFVKNSAPTELGTAGTKYVIKGWICVTSGEPGTWVQSRTLTGN